MMFEGERSLRRMFSTWHFPIIVSKDNTNFTRFFPVDLYLVNVDG
jgi:hypothetical protein